MTKTEIINEISRSTGIEKTAVTMVLETFTNIVRDTMAHGENVYIRGFGSFILKERKEKIARNISRNTEIVIPAHNVAVFKASKNFAAEIK